MQEEELTGKVIGAAMKVHTALGPGLLESAYEKCLLYELHRMELKALAQVELPVVYEEVKIDAGYRIDLMIEDKIIAELKAVKSILPIHKAQLLSYLKLRGKQIGLLLNFHVEHMRDGITRMVV